ncbi:hypothetical protein [Halosimplex amylolyticum]|uniref:hypothetical protein n=1 Tax=Halosimplex amylolyticum TaxID=3396616 RepID=UPI003F57570E
MNIIPRSTEESETARDGFLSTLREFHAAIIGLAVGVVVAMTGAWELAALFVFAALGAKLSQVEQLGDVRREPWYALGAMLVAIGAIEATIHLL